MNRLKNKAYGPPATLDYNDPSCDIRAVWGPTVWQQSHQSFVRNVPVTQLERASIDARNIGFARCVFPDGRIMTVNAGNIRNVKVKGNVHAIK